MNRRTFLTLASATPVGLLHANPADDALEKLRADWREATISKSSATVHSVEGELRLEVALIDENDKVTEETIKTEYGNESVFSFQGTKLPRGLGPHSGIIKSFKFFWNDKEIPIEKRFWNDFGGCHIEQTTIKRDRLPEIQQYQFDQFLEGLDGPKVVLSADKGTALIEWSIIDTDACCGHRATVRWMISKSGSVMRHRHTTPGAC